MSDESVHFPSPEFLIAFRREAGDGWAMSFADYMALALYDPAAGYYARARRRIGREAGSDFYTATSLGPVFGELVAAASADLLGPRPPGDFTFAEIGADDAGGALEKTPHPFGGILPVSLGQPLTLPPRAIVFSNELFDAQPCHRLVGRDGLWRELGVALRDNSLEEVLLPDLSLEVREMAGRLPPVAPEGYQLDLPLAAAQLVREIAVQSWSGLFVAIDYGKSWRELVEETPAGTVRAYHRHRQSNDLLDRPGEQDLTCHVCWDWMVEALNKAGFAVPTLESQEAFFVHHASPALGAIAAAEAGRLSSRKQGVMQLLHPANMGRKFQVLWALRD